MLRCLLFCENGLSIIDGFDEFDRSLSLELRIELEDSSISLILFKNDDALAGMLTSGDEYLLLFGLVEFSC